MIDVMMAKRKMSLNKYVYTLCNKLTQTSSY